MILGSRRKAQLAEHARDVFLDCARRDEEPHGDRLVRPSLGHQLEDLALAGRQVLDRVVLAPPPDELRDERRIERGAASATRRTAAENSSMSEMRSFSR